MFFLVQTYVYVTFYSYAFIYFHPWSYILNAQTSRRKSAEFFGITVYAFYMFFWLRYPLFEYILITCLICSRASYSPSSYGKKIHWGRGWLMQEFNFYYQLSVFVFSTISVFEQLGRSCLSDVLELLDSCEPFDFFEFTFPFSDTLLLLMQEHFDKHLAFCAASFYKKLTSFLKEQIWVSTFSNQPLYRSVSFSSYNLLYWWCASSSNYYKFCRAIYKSKWKKYT